MKRIIYLITVVIFMNCATPSVENFRVLKTESTKEGIHRYYLTDFEQRHWIWIESSNVYVVGDTLTLIKK